MSSSPPTWLVHAWCRLCLLDHQVELWAFISAPKPRIAEQKAPRPWTKSCAIHPAAVLPSARLIVASSGAVRATAVPTAKRLKHGAKLAASRHISRLYQPSAMSFARRVRKLFVRSVVGGIAGGVAALSLGRRSIIFIASWEWKASITSVASWPLKPSIQWTPAG